MIARAHAPSVLWAALAAAASLAGCSGGNRSGTDADGAPAGSDADAAGAPTCDVPSSFSWSSTGALLSPRSDATHDLTAIKDPSIVGLDPTMLSLPYNSLPLEVGPHHRDQLTA